MNADCSHVLSLLVSLNSGKMTGVSKTSTLNFVVFARFLALTVKVGR